MLKRAIVHIGLENTGTTYLQKALLANRSALKGAGYLYPRTGDVESHLELAAYSMDDDKTDTVRAMVGLNAADQTAAYRDKYKASLMEECAGANCHTAIFSSEHLSSRLTETTELARLRDLMASIAEEVKIVVYLRRQDEAWLSIYATSIRGGDVDDLAMPSAWDRSQRLDYRNILDRWAGTFGKNAVAARSYSSLVGGDTLSDFRSLLQIGVSLPNLPTRQENARLDARRLEFLRLLNYHLPAIENGALSVRRANISKLVEEMRCNEGPPLRLPDHLFDQLMPSFRESNEYVAREYLGDVREDGDPLFGSSSRIERGPIFELTIHDFAEMTAALWSAKQQDNRSLWLHVQQLKKRLGEET